MVRLKVNEEDKDKDSLYKISIPYGAIKRFDLICAITGIPKISIPYGAIKRR